MCDKRPNVLFVMTDQMNPFRTPVYGDVNSVMPAMSRLAEEGVVFSNAYCNSPLCSPSRASMMSGQLISTLNGAFDNASEFSSEVPTFAHLFAAAGYQTILSGKMHFIGPDQLHGFKQRLTTDIYPADFSWTPVDWDSDIPSHESYRNVLLNNKNAEWGLNIKYDEEVHLRAKQKLNDLAEGKRPFFMTVSYSHPHSPFMTSPRYAAMYKDTDISLDDVHVPEDLDEYNRFLAWDMGFDKPLSRDDVVRNRRNYYGMLSYVDDKLGELLDILDNTGMAENTVVVFTSDHGEMLGRKGMWEKRTFMEDSSRVPLIFRGTGISSGSRSLPVSLVDLFPTFIDMLGVDWPRDYLDGESLRDVLINNCDVDGKYIINEYYGECIKYPYRSIVTDEFKLVHFPGHKEHDLLFHIRNDPGETRNIIAAEGIAKEKERLYACLDKGFDFAAIEAELCRSRQRRRIINNLSKGGVLNMDWNFCPEGDSATRYIR